jgi:hypothetical protein
LGTLLVQLNERVEVVAEPTERLPGAVGAVGTFTVVVAVLVPLLFVAIRVYTVVEVGCTAVDPEEVDVLKLPGVIDIWVIVPVALQLNVDVAPEATIVGEAVKEEIVGD